MKILIRLSLVLGAAVLLLFLFIWGSLILNTRKAQAALSDLELQQVERWQIHWDEQEYRLRLAADWLALIFQQSSPENQHLPQEALPHLQNSGIHWLAKTNAAGIPTLVYSKNTQASSVWAELRHTLPTAQTDSWFELVNENCWQIYSKRIPSYGTIWIARPFDEQNAQIGGYSGSATVRFKQSDSETLSLRTASYGASMEDDTLIYRQPLPSLDGRMGMLMEVRWESTLQGLFISFYKSQINTIIFFCLIIQTVVFLSLYRWVVGPVSKITTAFQNRNSAPLEPLKKDGSELGLLARIVSDFFQQKDELEQEVSDRLQTEASLRESESLLKKLLLQRETLAHNLHDGIVQSLYATGLKLQMLRQKYRKDTPDIATEIQATCDQLNTIMRDVRGYLNDLEPTALEGNDLESALSQLCKSLPLPDGCTMSVTLPPDFSADLSRAQTVELFHCLHELCTNAIKHSSPSQITVEAIVEDSLATISVTNDGGVFNPPASHSSGSGKGLKSVASRMNNINGKLILPITNSQPTVFKIQFPLK